LHDGRFEIVHQRERTAETRRLRHIDADDALLRVDEEVRVECAAPAEAAFGQPRVVRDRIGNDADQAGGRVGLPASSP
jgi:hypothetical protein